MPAAHDHEPKYRCHKASGQALVRIDGRDRYLGRYGSAESRAEYHRLLEEWRRTGRQPGLDRREETTVAEVMAAYLAFARDYYRKGGRPTREYGKMVEVCRFVNPLFADARAVEFGPLALKTVRQSMIDAGHSRKHINQSVHRVRRMFRWAAEEEMIPAAVPQALDMVAGLRAGRTAAPERPPVLPVDDATVDATLPHLPEVVADMVRVQRLTGMRPAEVCCLRPCDLNRERDDVWLYVPESHKTEHHGRERVVFIGPQAQGVLLKYLARDPAMYCFRPCDSEAKRRAAAHAARKTPIKYGNKPGSNRKRKPKRAAGEKYSTESYRRAIWRGCDKAFPAPEGVEGEELKAHRKGHRWSPNRLRHAAGTEVRKRFGLEASQVVLGHANAQVTQVYAERDLVKGIEVARAIG